MDAPLWTSAEAAHATGGQLAGGLSTVSWQASGVSIDTRTLQPGDLFVALTAARDGHSFVAQALELGAAAALVAHRPEGVAEDAPLLIVPNVLEALADLGRAARARTKARVLAITGSVGKTSTKEMARAALTPCGAVHAAEASYNNHWGVPLTLARMPAATAFAVIEIGMSNPGEIAPLARMAAPDVALITTVAPAHLEAFESIEGIAYEKAALMDGLTPSAGIAVLNADIPTASILFTKSAEVGAQTRLFGQSEQAMWRLDRVDLTESHTSAHAQTPRGALSFGFSGAGRHHAMNALAVLAACDALLDENTPLSMAIEGLAAWSPPDGRGARLTLDLPSGGQAEVIDDAFNANPASVAASLSVFALARPKGRRIAILGDMLELGPDERALHAEIAQNPAMVGIAQVHCVGPRMNALWDALPPAQRGLKANTPEDLLPSLAQSVQDGDLVLVKGSKGSRVSALVDALRKLGHST